VRFVHFSKENELRSRLFSEKMGLESGWNCHISLRALTEEEKLEEEREERELQMGTCNSSTQRSSDQVEGVNFFNLNEVSQFSNPISAPKRRRPTLSELFSGTKRSSLNETRNGGGELGRCSASAPTMVMLAKQNGDMDLEADSDETKRLLDVPG